MAYERIGPEHPQYIMVQEKQRIGIWVCDALNHNADNLTCDNPLCQLFKQPTNERRNQLLEALLDAINEVDKDVTEQQKRAAKYLLDIERTSIELAEYVKKNPDYAYVFTLLSHNRIPRMFEANAFAISVAMISLHEAIKKEKENGL
jgi:hypothetical protein